MKSYTLKFSVTLIEGADDAYSPTKAIAFEVKEKLPANVDAEKHIRHRLAEEVKRNFATLPAPIDNFADEVKEAADPLAGDVPF